MKYLIAMLALGLGLFGQAQSTGEIQGKIFDETGLPMISASVSLKLGEQVFQDQTDLDGRFKLKPIPTGEHTIVITYIGYKKVEIDGISVTSDAITFTEDVKMGLDTENIGTAVIYSYRDPLIKKDEPQKMIIRSAEIEAMPVKNDIVGLVTAMSSDIKRDPNTDELYFRGSRSGGTQFVIDGIKYTGSNPGIPTSAMSSVSVYTGGVPAKYGDLTGGVIVMETKSYFELRNQKIRQLRAQGVEI